MMISLMAPFLALAMVQQLDTISVMPSSEVQAVQEFERTCVAGFRDVEILRLAAARSKRRYAAEAVDANNWRNWSSPYGTLHYFQGTGIKERTTPECNLTAFTSAPVNRRVLAEELEQMARRQVEGRSRLIVSEDDGRVTWTWLDAEQRPMSAMIFLNRKTPQQITLSLRPLAVSGR